jgi:hypothetical protein
MTVGPEKVGQIIIKMWFLSGGQDEITVIFVGRNRNADINAACRGNLDDRG